MKILVISPKNKTVFNFRGDLIRDMISAGNEVLVVGPNREYVDDIMALGVSEFVEVPLVKDNTSIKGDLAYLKSLKRVMREKRPDLVFSYTIKPVIYGSMAAKSAGVKHIYAMVTGLGRVYASGGIKTKLIRLATKMLYKKAFRACDKVIFQNADDIDQLVKGGYLPASKAMKVDGSGVNMERFTRAELPESPVFLMVSRIIREKGVMEYCASARELKKSVPGARCILLG
ncbi:MAG: glycosyltransferase, partial [Clostridia bacterium]|nr:glycosyltransferase [Clostridia bacterium]